MAEVFMFSARQVKAARTGATAVWRPAVTGQAHQLIAEGWSISPVDPAAMVSAMPALRMKPGYVLRAYQYRADRDGNGVVWALPTGARFPKPGKGQDEPPRPPRTLDNVMQAIDGDGTPLSYLSASLLAREFSDFGAFGHGVQWGKCVVLDSDPWLPFATKASSVTAGPSGTKQDWQWLDELPADWRPTVGFDEDGVMVVLYAYSGLGSQRILRIVDTYQRGEYTPDCEEKNVGIGPAGFKL